MEQITRDEMIDLLKAVKRFDDHSDLNWDDSLGERLDKAISALQAVEPVAWQFYQDGEWHNGDDSIKGHRENTEAADIPARDLFALPSPPAKETMPEWFGRWIQLQRDGSILGYDQAEKRWIILRYADNHSFNRESKPLGPAILAFRQTAKAQVPDELRGVADADGGWWGACTGCYESEGGHPSGSYPYSEIFKCTLGTGCHECGGLGAKWQIALDEQWLSDSPAPDHSGDGNEMDSPGEYVRLPVEPNPEHIAAIEWQIGPEGRTAGTAAGIYKAIIGVQRQQEDAER